MRNITKIRQNFRWLRNTSLVVALILLLSLFLPNFLRDMDRSNLITGLVVFGLVLWFRLHLLCREAIFKFGHARRDFLDILEAHHELMRLASDEQIMTNLASTPEGILDTLVQNLNAKRKEAITRRVNARIALLENGLKTHPDSENEDGAMWLEFKYELTRLRILSEALKRNR